MDVEGRMQRRAGITFRAKLIEFLPIRTAIVSDAPR